VVSSFEWISKNLAFRNKLKPSMRLFGVVWAGQVVSLLGSAMTGFALGVWIYRQTGSTWSFALTLLFNMLPKALIAPLAGLLADRLDRRWIMIVTDLVAGSATMVAAMLFWTGQLNVWHVYLLTAMNASASALQGPAFSAALTQLVPKSRFGRANGMLQFGEGVAQVIAPLLAGSLIAIFGLQAVLMVDVVTFLFAVSTLVLVRFPPVHSEDQSKIEFPDAWSAQFAQAITYLKRRPGLLGLLAVFALVNFFIGMAEAVLTPMVLSFTTITKLALIMTVGGIGMMAGSVLASAFGDRWRKIYAVFGAYAVIGAAVFLAGLKPSVPLVATAVFLAFLALPSVMSASQAILQSKVEPHLQGRVFGLRIFANTFAFALAYLSGGFLADYLFEPLMATGGQLGIVFGPWLGVGPGRGMGLMFVLMGILSIAIALSAFVYPRIRRVELELPDMV
jgi:DHA3 family macrolide efflux protein-like MFS transporter